MSLLRPLRDHPLGCLAVVFRGFPLVACGLALACAGCNGSKGYRVSGTVTFKGQPVPAGKIYFTPVSAKGNSGPQGYAEIKDGRYDTGAKGGQGTPGGYLLVTIEGFDGPTPLFAGYETAVELPKETVTRDFEVPAAAAALLPQNPGPPP